MRTLTTVLSIIVLAFVAGYGWAIWHVLTHSAIHIMVHDYGLATESRLYGDPPDVQLQLLDGAGRMVANARTVESERYFVVVHPDPAIADCRRYEGGGATAAAGQMTYRDCYKKLSRWASQWATSVSATRFASPTCSIASVPARVQSDLGEWWLWWVPNPHIGGTPYRYVTIEFDVDTRTCRAIDGTR